MEGEKKSDRAVLAPQADRVASVKGGVEAGTGPGGLNGQPRTAESKGDIRIGFIAARSAWGDRGKGP